MILMDARVTAKNGQEESMPEYVVAEDFRDLTTGDVIERGTSYIGGQTEVSEIFLGLDQRCWPDVWYELIQGAFEYNDWSKGPPQILITYQNGEVVTLASFILNWPRKKTPVQKVSVINHIKADTGLRPSNLYLTYHHKKQGETEYGNYGRGLKGAATAIAAYKLANRITFESYAEGDGLGSWFGEARMAKDAHDKQAPDHYQVVYKCSQAEQIDRTTITVEQPNDLLLEALLRLPDWFIPLNPNYQFSPTVDPAELFTSQTLNHLTIPPLIVETDQQSASNRYDGYPPNARVEILNQALFQTEVEPLNWLVVDGWRATGFDGQRFANVYAFSGFSKNPDNSRNPYRSNDSTEVEGNYQNLIVDALCHCEDPQVFYRIFQHGLSDSACFEWLYLESMMSQIVSYPRTMKMVAVAWEKYASEHQIADQVYVATSANELAQASERYGISTLVISSIAWQEVLFSAGKVRYLNSFLAEEANSQRRKAEAKLAELGILELANHTGEVLKLPKLEADPAARHQCVLELIYSLACHGGKFSFDPTESAFSFEFDETMLAHSPQSLSQMGDLGKIITNLYALFGSSIVTFAKVQILGESSYFNFGYDPNPDQLGNHSLEINRGKLTSANSPKIELKLRLGQESQQSSTQERAILQLFFQELKASLEGVSFPDGRLNIEVFQSSELSRQHPQAHFLIEMRRQRAELEKELAIQFALANELRKSAGLPPLTLEGGSLRSFVSSEAKRRDLKSLILSLLGRPLSNKSPASSPQKGDVRIYESTLKLGHPDEDWSLSTLGEKDRLLQLGAEMSVAQRLTQQLRQAMEERLEAQIDPDLLFNPGSYQFNQNLYLIHSIDRLHSTVSTADYRPLADLPVGHQIDAAAITFNKTDTSNQARSLPCPYGFEPVGYFNPNSQTKLKFSGLPQKGVFAFHSPKGIEAGLIVYFRPIRNFADKSEPDEIENRIKVIEEKLEPYWKNLLGELKTSSLTDKQKVDILLTAWKKNQIYKKYQTTFDQYKGLSGLELVTEIANRAEGNCGYIDLGFIGLVSILFPTRSIKSLLFSGKGLDISKSRHGLSQVFFNGQWVAIEAQGRYVEPGYDLEPIPASEREKFEALLAEVPVGNIPDVVTGAAVPKGLEKGGDKIIKSLPIAAILTALKSAGIDSDTILDKIEYIFTTDSTLTKREFNLRMLKFGVATGLASLGGAWLHDVSIKVTQIAVAYETSAKGTSMGEILNQIGPMAEPMDNSKLIMIAIIVLPIIGVQLGYLYKDLLVDMKAYIENNAKLRALETEE